MSARLRPLLVLAAPLAATALGAEGPDDARRFPRQAHLLLLPDEQALLKELQDDKDRRAFQGIFWARRDPTPGTTANEFADNVRAAWKLGDQLFSYPNERGSETGCGQVLALLGHPEDVVRAGDTVRNPTAGAGRPFDNLAYVRDGAIREPETWVYRDRPGVPFRFTGAELRVQFDAECRFAEAGIVAEDLRRAAAVLVTRPELAYARSEDGHLVPLAAAAAATSASASSAAGSGLRALFATPRTDFPLAVEPKLVMRTARGETYVAGLVQATADSGPTAGSLSVAVEAKDANGQTAATSSLVVTASPSASGRLVASWALPLRPGRYKLAVAAQLAERGSVASLDLDVPDFGGKTLAVSPLVAYPDEPQPAAAPGPGDPYAALHLGPLRLRPRFGNVFGASDALMVVAALYGAKLDASSGKAVVRSRFSILKDGKPVARGAEDVFESVDAVASVGPIPLGSFAPGAYVVRLDVTDALAGQTLRQELPIEIREP